MDVLDLYRWSGVVGIVAGVLNVIVELLPENPEFDPIIVDTRREEFVIEGLGVGVIRAGRSL